MAFAFLGLQRRGLANVRLCCEKVEFQRPNINRPAPDRTVISTDKSSVRPEEVNELLTRSGKKARSIYKISKAMHFSVLVVSVRLGRDETLVAIARAVSDGALNSTIWDLVVDPSVPNQDNLKTTLVGRTLTELRGMVPGCSVALIASESDAQLYHRDLSFVPDFNGVQIMAMEEENWDSYL